MYAQYKRHVEDPFYNLTRRHPEFFTGGHIIDVGANIGYTAGVFARVIQPGFHVWAFEPSSENFQHLQNSIGHRRLQDVITARRAAVADRVGTMDLVLNPDHPGDHHLAPLHRVAGARQRDGAVEGVPVTTIDEEVRNSRIVPISFIKIDVQGYELHVCRGMSETLDANPGAAVVVEYAPDLLRPYGVQPEEFSQFLALRGYDAYRVTQRGTLEAMRALPRVLPAPGYVDILFTRTAQDVDRS